MTYWMDDDAANRRGTQDLVNPAGPGPAGPGFFEGAGGAASQGIKFGIDQLAVGVGDFTTPYLQAAADPLDDLLGTDLEAWLEGQRVRAHDIARANRIDPATVGTAGQILHGATSVVTQALIGSIAGGPVGGALAAGGGTGYGEYTQLVEMGVDADTAAKVAGITAVDTAIGVAVPLSIGGGLLGAVAWGVGTNVAMGAAGRYDSGRVLKEAGYDEMAAQYQALDGMAIATDAVMGAMFPLAGKGAEMAKDRFLPKGVRDKLTPEQADAADVAARAVHEQRDLSPGLHTTPDSANAHEAAMARMENEVLVEGKDPRDVDLTDVAARIEVLPDPAAARTADEVRAAVEAETPAEVRMEMERVAQEAARVEVSRAMDAQEQAAVAEASVAPKDGPGSLDQPLPPEAADTAPVGAWVSDGFRDNNGEVVSQVREVPVDDLYLPELDRDGNLQPEKRKYLPDYTARAKAGEQPPNLRAVEMEDGRIRVVDGHRRALAAKAAGQETVRVAVSPLVDTPDGRVPATKELLQAERDAPPLPKVDPTDPAAVARQGDIGTLDNAAVRQILDEAPDITVPDPDNPGQMVTARELMQRMDADIETAKEDAELAQVAAACFLRFQEPL